MTLYFIGIGMDDEKDVTIRGLEQIKQCEKIYLESYTCTLNCDVSKLEEFYGKKIILASRATVEQEAEKTILEDAKNFETAFLVVGDPLAATTHTDLFLRARELGIDVGVVNNASVLTAIGIVGLQLYKYGKTTSIPFPEENFKPETAYEVIKENQKCNLHTLVLLDLRPDEKRYMTVKQAIEILLEIEEKRKEKVFTADTVCVGCARLGSKDFKIISGSAKELSYIDFGKPVHCLIIPSKMHFAEEEMLKHWKNQS